MNKLTVVVLTANSEKIISDCLNSLSFADEVIVIDDESTDKTVSIVQKSGAHIYVRKLDNFASQRNYGLDKAKGAWTLFVDADERISKELQNEIISVVRGS
ncbi:glycosyltransferase family 2 protein [Candidatus Roizmanbacteria bacterium]|nr:glycosyltransferase family 2 protein [Candidatus Roizmanbacteria bacterium]